MSTELDARWMRRCIALAGQGLGRTSPNPMVGAVVVRDGEVLAEGWHRAAGQPHAEVDALSQLGGRAPGATMVVNLEPCCHHGRTPPCTDAILASGVRRVVVGMVDPDARVRGRGLAILRDAGIEVVQGVEEPACRRLNAAYLSAKERGRPLVVLKAALTLDGRIASASGESRWITGPEARHAGHCLRDACDAVLVGAGTLRADDPSLNTRVESGRDALPVILDSTLSIAADARVLRAGRRPLLFCAEGTPARELPADLVAVPREAGGLQLDAVLAELLDRGVHSVLVEGGAAVHRSFIEAGLVDRLELFVAPLVLAGGPGWLGGPPFELAQAPRFQLASAVAVGGDLHVTLDAGG